MDYEVRINGRFPSNNEFIDANRRNRFMGAKMKKDTQTLFEFQIRQQLKDVKIHSKIRLHYICYEPNYRRDLDNVVAFLAKCFQDALVNCGVIKNDSPRYIDGFSSVHAVDKEHPHIIVMIEVIK